MSTELLNLLIVDDDSTLAASLKLMAPAGFKVYVVSQPDLIPDHVFYHAAMIDMHIQTKVGDIPDGPTVIQKLIKKNQQTEVVSMSGDLNRQNMEMAIKSGAARFLAKPLIADEVTLTLEKILAYWQLRRIDSNFKNKTQMIGVSTATEQIQKTIASLKGEKSAILIEGETGTGKDVVARILNQQEGSTPFITVNCAALTENLFESEFFGHIKGAFTGADQNKVGLAEAAHGGDLFLDEIEALPLSQQAKLLRFLETGEIKKVGSKEFIHVDVRVIAASNEPLNDLIQQKKFREDLYFRLSSHKIFIPSLKSRSEDIPSLSEHFLAQAKNKRQKSFEADALDVLKIYAWPGNIRELKRVCEQLSLTSPLPFIRAEDVQHLLAINLQGAASASLATFNLNSTLDQHMNEQEKQFITAVLEKIKNIDEACQTLQISKSSLYKKIKDHSIQYE